MPPTQPADRHPQPLAPGSRARAADGPTVCVLGATGLVGLEMLALLEQRALPVGRLLPLASGRAGVRSVRFAGDDVPVLEATPERLAEADLVLSSAGGEVSRRLLPDAAAAGAVCIDNTSAFRMHPDCPLVVPEVNPSALDGWVVGSGRGGIIANPNCSTIQLLVALAPLHAVATLRRAVVSTYQSVSGAGRGALELFRTESAALLQDPAGDEGAVPRSVAFDVLPLIGEIDGGGDTDEELKMVRETARILDPAIAVDVTCVRVPVVRGHAETVWIETAEPLSVSQARDALAAAPGVRVDEPGVVTTPRRLAGQHAVHVSRLRPTRGATHGLSFWVVADNLLKGAALNAVQIAELLLGSAPADAGPRDTCLTAADR